MVSPLSVSSTVKEDRYNSEAVQRLFDGHHESSFAAQGSAVPPGDEDQALPDPKTPAATPKQKPQSLDCLPGVKRIMKTPTQEVEPVEDLRGKILKTPKQKPVQQQQECLTGVKRIMKTPKQKAEPVEDLRGKILKTPKQKLEPQECLTGVKRIFETPQAEGQPIGEARDELEVCNAVDVGDQTMMTHVQTASVKSSPPECLTDVKRMMTPREKSAPVEDLVGVRRLRKTPKEKYECVEEHFGIKRLVKTPRQKASAPVEDFEGLKELMEEPQPERSGQLETNEVTTRTFLLPFMKN